ncbi:MAG: fused MFS/spermidine synthase [Candidatus Fermentibacteraceae bacterium]
MRASANRGAHFFVFFTGAAVMATEMCASRFLAPWFGTSMIVWSVLIAVVLAAMSVGYWLGGRLADRRPSWVVLYWIPAIAGALIALIPPLGGILFARLSAGIMATPVNIIILAFVGVVAVFVPPVLLLAMVSPFMIRLLAKADNTGRTAGSLYAMSTLGSIAGTLFSTLVTIPLLGTRETLFLVSGVLILLGIVGLRQKARVMPVLLVLPLAGWLAFSGSVRRDETVVHEEESVYQYLQVQRRSDGSTILVVNEGGAMQSIAREGDALRPASTYYESYLLLPYMIGPSDEMDVLVIGSGAGTIPHWLAVHVRPDIPGLRTDAVEIDRRAAELGYQWFNTQRDDARMIISDGRTYIGNTSRTYDIIITDTYSNQIYIPFHLTTVEYFTELRAHLNSGGAVAMNVNALSEDSDLIQALGATLYEVFPLVYIVHVSNDYNFMLIASEYPLHAPSADSMAVWNPVLEETARLFEPIFKPFDPKDGLILTDNRAPVEFLTDMMIIHEAAGRAR